MPPDIAVIDSGINPGHPHVGQVSGGHGYLLNSDGEVETTSRFDDEIGHGTAIAGILREKAPGANLYSIKIFQWQLSAQAAVLITALEWAVDHKFKIIHLSLGSQAAAYREKLESLCQIAYDRGSVVVAAARGLADEVYPAVFETVIGVFWNRDCFQDQFSYHPGAKVEFGAHGQPRALPGIPQEMNFRGHSFAAAHVTGTLAGIVTGYPEAPIDLLREKLCRLAIKSDHAQRFKVSPGDSTHP